jgi:ankyrin repeat protein
MRYQANVNFMNQQRETSLIVAAEGGHAEVTHLLLLGGADVTIQDLNGHTALMRAATEGHASVCSIALDFGANPSTVSPVDGNTASTLAAAKGYTDVYAVLVAAGSVVRAVVEEETEADEYEDEEELNSYGPSIAMGYSQSPSGALRSKSQQEGL